MLKFIREWWQSLTKPTIEPVVTAKPWVAPEIGLPEINKSEDQPVIHQSVILMPDGTEIPKPGVRA